VKALAREHLHLSRWSVWQALFNWIAFLQAFVLGYFYSAESVAILVSIRSIGNAANVLLEQLETIVPVWFAHLAGKIGLTELKFSTGRLLLMGILIWIIGVLLILVFGKFAIRLILGERFEPYSFILLIAWFGNGIYFVNRVAGLYWRSQKNVKAEFFGSIGGLVMFLGSIPVIAKYGLEGAAWGYVLVPAGTATAQYLYARSRKFVV
jgi:O-antigen/teichoic acid export membrane protein